MHLGQLGNVKHLSAFNTLPNTMTVTASLTKSYSYTDSVETMNAERAEAGEPPMTREEIEEYVREDITLDGGDGDNAEIQISDD